MQRYRIIHHTYYNFSSNVQLEPHALRLRPREGHELHIESSTLEISPSATLLWHRDVEGNSVAIATFETLTNQLAIKSEVLIQQYIDDPFDFLVSDYAIDYPFNYEPDDRILLAPYIEARLGNTSELLIEWLNHLWKQGELIQTYTLLQRIGTQIHQTLSYRLREEPGLQTPEQTLTYGTGSCRDFALLFMEAARYLGLASRFVSGYLYEPASNGQPGSTHAWAEVYLPGAGWKGFDPTTGNIAGADHIAVAVARLPESIPPVAGSFVGIPGSSLEVGVWVNKF